jgi:hypothetical protein
MTEAAPDPGEIERLLALSNDQLYTMMVPAEAARQLNHPGAAIEQGKSAFVSLIRRTRGAICQAYSHNREIISNSVELVSLAASAMMGAAGLVKEEVLPAAVLVTKIGLEAICKSENPTHGTAI